MVVELMSRNRAPSGYALSLLVVWIASLAGCNGEAAAKKEAHKVAVEFIETFRPSWKPHILENPHSVENSSIELPHEVIDTTTMRWALPENTPFWFPSVYSVDNRGKEISISCFGRDFRAAPSKKGAPRSGLEDSNAVRAKALRDAREHIEGLADWELHMKVPDEVLDTWTVIWNLPPNTVGDTPKIIIEKDSMKVVEACPAGG